ncbi:MAG: SPOR domain-containing protein [Chitinophagales bacterium]|nr:SPOR domain-containing protein [Chitinophagales bacterium]
MKQLLTVCCLLVSMFAVSQNSGNIEIVADSRLDELMDLYHKEDSKSPVVMGYRIQLFSSSSRSEAQAQKDKFYAQFPDIRPFIEYQAPNFKLRIGTYRNRMEAYRDLTRVNLLYPNAFIVKTEIPLNDL